MSVDEQLRELHAHIEKDFEVRLAQLEAERKERHEALDKLWPIISDFTAALFPSPETAIKANEAGNGLLREGRKAFPMRRTVSEMIDKLEEGAEISQPRLYDMLLEQYQELREQPPVNMRAQIASILNWLTKGGRVIVAKEGRGSYPNVYRKPTDIERAFPEKAQHLLRENS
jgi:hypothetical protein